jgi:uncharacterized DUF497 family protein
LNQKHFWWDEINIEHIADHGVEPFEAEEVIVNRPLILRAGEGKYLAYGQTDGGRFLVVVFASKEEQRLRVITARDMTQAEKSRFRNKKK